MFVQSCLACICSVCFSQCIVSASHKYNSCTFQCANHLFSILGLLLYNIGTFELEDHLFPVLVHFSLWITCFPILYISLCESPVCNSCTISVCGLHIFNFCTFQFVDHPFFQFLYISVPVHFCLCRIFFHFLITCLCYIFSLSSWDHPPGCVSPAAACQTDPYVAEQSLQGPGAQWRPHTLYKQAAGGPGGHTGCEHHQTG